MAAAAPLLYIDGDGIRVPASAFSHAGFRAWVTSADFPELRATFVDGEVLIEMSPESIEAHNKVKGAITVALGTIIATGDLGEYWMDGALLTNESAALSTEPDFSFATWKTLEAGHVSFVQKSDRVAGNSCLVLLRKPHLCSEGENEPRLRFRTMEASSTER